MLKDYKNIAIKTYICFISLVSIMYVAVKIRYYYFDSEVMFLSTAHVLLYVLISLFFSLIILNGKIKCKDYIITAIISKVITTILMISLISNVVSNAPSGANHILELIAYYFLSFITCLIISLVCIRIIKEVKRTELLYISNFVLFGIIGFVISIVLAILTLSFRGDLVIYGSNRVSIVFILIYITFLVLYCSLIYIDKKLKLNDFLISIAIAFFITIIVPFPILISKINYELIYCIIYTPPTILALILSISVIRLTKEFDKYI